jgi:hypothetical protein
MRSGDRRRLGTAITFERRPDAGKRAQRPVVVQREPHHIPLLRLRVRLRRVFGEGIEWHQAAVPRRQSAAPAEIEYRAKSAEGKVRHPLFKGLREDI